MKVRISYYLGQPYNEFKGNRSVGEPRKVNSAILYKSEFDPEKQTITVELYVLKLLGDQVWKIMMQVKKEKKSSGYALNSNCIPLYILCD